MVDGKAFDPSTWLYSRQKNAGSVPGWLRESLDEMGMQWKPGIPRGAGPAAATVPVKRPGDDQHPPGPSKQAAVTAGPGGKAATDPTFGVLVMRGARPVPDPGTLSRKREDEADRHAAGLRRRLDDRRQQVQRAYHQLRRDLGIEPLEVLGDGDCFYRSLLMMFGLRLRDILGQEPTIRLLRDRLRAGLADELARADRGEPTRTDVRILFPQLFTGAPAQWRHARDVTLRRIETMGDWDYDAGDSLPEFAAQELGLPITLLGQDRPHHIGPARPPEAYMIYENWHYMGTKQPDGQVVSADVLYQRPDGMPWVMAPEPAAHRQKELVGHLRIYRSRFEAVQDGIAATTTRAPALLGSREARHGWQVAEAFWQLSRDLASRVEIVTQGTADRLGRMYLQLQDTARELAAFADFEAATLAWSADLRARFAQLADGRSPALEARGQEIIDAFAAPSELYTGPGPSDGDWTTPT